MWWFVESNSMIGVYWVHWLNHSTLPCQHYIIYWLTSFGKLNCLSLRLLYGLIVISRDC